jgi:uncharacterized protein
MPRRPKPERSCLVFAPGRRYNPRFSASVPEAAMTTAIPILPVARQASITPENKCSFCKGSTCCTYLTQQIDTPRKMEDFDLMLWQISHANTQFYKDSDGWFILVNNRCLHLEPGGRCAVYDTRPQVCRDHDNDDCEFEGPCGHDDFYVYFPTYDSLLKYCRKKFKNWDKRFKQAATTTKKKKKP